MRRFAKSIQAVGIVLLLFMTSACLSVQVIRNVEDPSTYFRRAYLEIEKLHQDHPQREGRVHRLCLLIHDGSSCEIVRLSVPLWLVNVCLDLGIWATESHGRYDYEKRYDFDWRAIKDFSQLGPGLLVEVEEERDKILIWLK